MTNLLDADWLIGVQLFHYACSSRINDFQTNKVCRRGISKNGTAPEELKEKVLDEIRRKAPNFSLSENMVLTLKSVFNKS